MKKLVTSIMATAMILGVSSCGDHDFEAPVSYNQQVQEAFDAAFIKEFGHVHPDQNWGFSNSNTKAVATRAALEEEMSYPACDLEPADNLFKRNAEGIQHLYKGDEIKDGCAYYMTNGDTKVELKVTENYNKYGRVYSDHFDFTVNEDILKKLTQDTLSNWNDAYGLIIKVNGYTVDKVCLIQNGVSTELFKGSETTNGDVNIGTEDIWRKANLAINDIIRIYYTKKDGNLNWPNFKILGRSYNHQLSIPELTKNSHNTVPFDFDDFSTTGTRKAPELYITGNVTPSEGFYLDGGSTLYICSNSTLNLTNSQAGNLQKDLKIYMAEKSKLTITDCLASNKLPLSGVTIYNKGTIDVYSLDVTGTGVLYNCAGGTVTLTGDLRGTNSDSKIINNGTVNCKNLRTQGSSKMWNDGTMTVSDSTIINSNDNYWINTGTYTTKEFYYTAGSPYVYNNCKLTVKNDFKINLGDNTDNSFNILGQGSMWVIGKFIMDGPSRVKMGSGTLIKTTELVANITTRGGDGIKRYGIHGVGSELAVVQADKVIAPNLTQEYNITYSGKLAVDAKSEHFALISDDGGHKWNYYLEDGAVLVSDLTEQLVLSSNCSHGYSYTPVPPKEDDPVEEEDPVDTVRITRVYVEDLYSEAKGGKSDWDFNDVVFDVVSHLDTDGETILYTDVVLRAAGGTLPLTLTYNGKTLDVHKLFGVDVTTMVNTSGVTIPDKVIEEFRVNGTAGINPADIIINVKHDDEHGWILIDAVTGEPAAKFAVELDLKNYKYNDYRWPSERTHIENRFPNFSTWVSTNELLKVNTDIVK